MDFLDNTGSRLKESLEFDGPTTRRPTLQLQADEIPCRLFTYPCGTPIDFMFSQEILPARQVYWTQYLNVGGFTSTFPVC
jgi:hypothetical protein